MRLHATLKAADIAARFNAELIGDKDAVIGSINEIHKLEDDSITFVDHPKYYDKVLQSKARVILINNKAECPKGKTLLVVAQPFDVYNQLALEARPFLPSNETIANTAIIGEGTIVMPGCVVGHHVKIGRNSVIHPNVIIYPYSEIGNNVIIHANTVIGSDAYYYHKDGEVYSKMHSIGRAIVHNDVEIGSGCTIDSGVSGDTIIGQGTKLDNQVHIGHGVVLGKNCLLAAKVAIAGKTIVGNNVILYGKVGVSKGLKIGDNAVVLASSDVDKNLEPNLTYFGSPAIPARDKWKEMATLRMLTKVWKQIVLKDDPQN